MYKSPINMIYGKLQTQIDGEIMRAVQQVDIHVDKEELIRALQYDRDQYEKGYRDGLNAIIRCRECQHFGLASCNANLRACEPQPDDYCSWAERREEE